MICGSAATFNGLTRQSPTQPGPEPGPCPQGCGDICRVWRNCVTFFKVSPSSALCLTLNHPFMVWSLVYFPVSLFVLPDICFSSLRHHVCFQLRDFFQETLVCQIECKYPCLTSLCTMSVTQIQRMQAELLISYNTVFTCSCINTYFS